MSTGLSCIFILIFQVITGHCMISQKLIPMQGVYSLEKWTKPNPLIITDLLPADISSEQSLFFAVYILWNLNRTLNGPCSEPRPIPTTY